MMKKFVRILTVCVLSLALAGVALADGEYANAGALYQAWFELNGYEQPYPEYITSLMGDEYGIYACGIYDMENVMKISIDETNPKAEKIMADLFAKYGDRIAFEEMDGRFVTLEDTRLEESRDMGGEPPFLPAALGLLAILLAVVLPVLIRRSRKEEVK